MSNLNAKLVALQLLGVAERVGHDYIKYASLWITESDEFTRLVELRKQIIAITAYRLAEEAFTDLDILFAEYPMTKFDAKPVDPAEIQGKMFAAIMKLENPSEQKVMELFQELAIEEFKQAILTADRSKAIADWDKYLADKRAQIETMQDPAPARVESANIKLQLALELAFPTESPSLFTDIREADGAIEMLVRERKSLLARQETIALLIAAQTQKDEHNPALLKAIRLNQSANVFFDQYRKSVQFLAGDLKETKQDIAAMIERAAAEDEQMDSSIDKLSTVVDDPLSMASNLATEVTVKAIDVRRQSTLTGYVDSAELELSLAEKLLLAAEAQLN